MNTQECCNHNCNQGRDCPLRNVKMNNEPVAWINREEGSGSILDWEKDPYSEVNIPLYTHPVKEQDESFDRTASHMAGEYVSYKKELTDEEIFDVADEFPFIENGTERLNFARAILRKVQK